MSERRRHTSRHPHPEPEASREASARPVIRRPLPSVFSPVGASVLTGLPTSGRYCPIPGRQVLVRVIDHRWKSFRCSTLADPPNCTLRQRPSAVAAAPAGRVLLLVLFAMELGVDLSPCRSAAAGRRQPTSGTGTYVAATGSQKQQDRDPGDGHRWRCAAQPSSATSTGSPSTAPSSRKTRTPWSWATPAKCRFACADRSSRGRGAWPGGREDHGSGSPPRWWR
jgi:hypothetical protein